eukprot:4619332-Amphidinium_carterae.1
MRPQFVHQDNGIEHDHKRAMALHKWNGPESTMVNGQHVTMRVGTPPNNGPDMTITSSVSITHSSVTMTVTAADP